MGLPKRILLDMTVLFLTMLFFLGVYMIDMGHNGIIVEGEYKLISLTKEVNPNDMYHLGFMFVITSFVILVFLFVIIFDYYSNRRGWIHGS